MSWKVPQTSNIQVETIRLINGLISCWKCLKYGHWGRNLSSIVSRLCNTLSSEKIFGSCWALTTVSFSRQRSSMLCSGFSFAKTIYLQNNDDMREGRNKLEENTFIANISETAAVASTVLPLYANFFPLSLPPSFSSYRRALTFLLLHLKHVNGVGYSKGLWRKRIFILCRCALGRQWLTISCSYWPQFYLPLSLWIGITECIVCDHFSLFTSRFLYSVTSDNV